MANRFDYVKYDDQAVEIQNEAKAAVMEIEALVGKIKGTQGNTLRSKSLAMTKLEEVYMWLGKAIRDDQIERNGSAPLQEDRTNS